MLASVGCKLGYDNVLLSAFILSAATLRCLTSCLMTLLISLVHVPTRSVAMLRASSTWSRLVFLCIFIMFLLGGFNLEGNVVVLDDPDMHEQSEWTEQFLLQVEEEKRAIEELPFVKSVGFTYGETANANKVLATVWCCWEASRLFKQIAMACHLEERPPARGAAQKARNRITGLLFRKQPVAALPPAQLWEITAGSESLILLWCCC